MRYLIILLTLLTLISCQKRSASPAAKPISAVTTNFTLYDFTRIIGGDRIAVSLLLKPGVESHTYEPTPKDMINVKNADLLICIGLAVEPWVSSLAKGAAVPADRIVETGRSVQFMLHDHEEEESGHEEKEHSCTHAEHAEHSCSAESGKGTAASAVGPQEGGDPHIWLDPVRAMLMVEEIAVKCIEIDTAGAVQYRHRADSLKQEINALHLRLDSTLSSVKNRTLMYAGHFAFGYFTDRYKLEHLSPYAGFSPNAEPTPAKIAEMTAAVKKNHIRAVYFEELTEPKTARVITEETGTEMLLLHGIHNVSSAELSGTFSYLTGMEENRIALAKGLAQ